MLSRITTFFVAILSVATLCLSPIAVAIQEPTSPLQARRDKILIEALLRLPKADVKKDEKTNALVLRFLKNTKDGNLFLKVVEHTEPENSAQLLWEFAQSDRATDSTAVQAIESSLNRQGETIISKWILENKEKETAHQLLGKLALANHVRVSSLLSSVVTDPSATSPMVAVAAQGMARNKSGQTMLIALAKDGKLRGDAKPLVAGVLRSSTDPMIAASAAELFPLPMSKDQKPLPPIDELAKRSGKANEGEKLFRGVATCANCHLVKGFGKSVGPDLSEIGNKLTREAMFVAILDPSAGISHNYESYILQTDSGEVATGLLVSQTDDEIILKDSQGIERKFPREEVTEFKKQEKSLMPENLHHNFDEQGLIDVVEYMLSLKKE